MADRSPGALAEALKPPVVSQNKSQKSKSKKGDKNVLTTKRRCVSSACIACRRRKSKCDGNVPSCAACASVYGTECVYDPNSDHRRKGVYKKDIDSLKTRNTTLQTLIQGILNYPETEVYDLVRQIRTCDNLEDVAEEILTRDAALGGDSDDDDGGSVDSSLSTGAKIEKELSGKMGELRLENGSVRFLGGTSNLLYLDSELGIETDKPSKTVDEAQREDSVTSWTTVTSDKEIIIHLLNMYFTWHYTYFATLSKSLFFRDFFRGKRKGGGSSSEYCTPLLVNAMLTLGCHFTSLPASRSDPSDPSTAGDHFFREAKRLIVENDEFENPRLATVQALALMSVREAGCGREAKGWVYSGMSFRMACDLGLNLGLTGGSGNSSLNEQEVDARRITFWGCFLFDKCWSNYLGRTPQLVVANTTAPKFDVFPEEDADIWSPWTDAGSDHSHAQPSRTRAIALQISTLCEISSDLLLTFYRPAQQQKPLTKPAEVKRLSDFHTRLEAWRKKLPKEMEPREGQLPNIILMHMFFHLLFIHLFRPFLKYTQTNSPLPPQVSPRKMCTQAAINISKLFRLYKKTYGLKQICNIAVYIAHSACTIHLLNLPDKDARRDISHGVRHLEEIAGSWLCASRTLATLGIQARRWKIELPEDTASILQRWESKYRSDHLSQAVGKISPTIEQAQRVASTKSNTPASTDPKPPDALFPKPSSTGPEFLPEPETQSAGPYTQTSTASFTPAVPIYPEQQSLATLQAPQDPEPNWEAATSTVAPTPSLTSSTQSQQQSQPRRPSYSTLFPALDTIFEDSKEWWLRDQSLFFDHWGARRESNNIVGTSPATATATSTAVAPNSVTSRGIISTTSPNAANQGMVGGANGLQAMAQDDNIDMGMDTLGHWGYGAGAGEGGYEYNGQVLY